MNWLAFADQKVAQVTTLARGLADGRDAIAAELDAASAALADRLSAPGVRVDAVRARTAALTGADFDRGDYDARVAAQSRRPGPARPAAHHDRILPADRRDPPRPRAVHHAARSPRRSTTGSCARRSAASSTLQEELGLDVLVHGEPERNDMVQYFAENLDGFDVTENGWVQSYGSRCHPPVDPVGRRVPSGADHGRLVAVRAVAHREADEGHADRPGHDPRLVVRAR